MNIRNFLRRPPSRRMAARRGVATMEFAVIGTALIMLTCAIVGGGMALWIMTGLQSVAGTAARCGAVGTTCTSPAQTQNFAVNLATSQVTGGVITASDVQVTSPAAACGSVSGTFYTVAITCRFFATGAMSLLAKPFNFSSFTVSSCYPMA